MRNFSNIHRYYPRGDYVEEMEESIDELSVQRWLNESKANFKAHQERFRETGSDQDKFDLLLKYLEVKFIQTKKQSMKRDA
jgi:hypothetical protein